MSDSLCNTCGDIIINGVCSCPIGSKEVYSEVSELRAEVLDLRRVLGPHSTVEIALKAQERMVLQVGAWDKEVREAIRLRAVCGPTSGPFNQQMMRLYKMLRSNETGIGYACHKCGSYGRIKGQHVPGCEEENKP